MPPTSTESVPDYAERLRKLHRVFAPELRTLIRTLVRDLPGVRGGRVHDVACGDGDYTRLLAQETDARHVVGFDVDGAFIERARRFLPPSLERRVRFEETDVCDDGRNIEPADVTFCADSFRSIEPGKLLGCLRSVTAAGRRIVVTETDPITPLRTSASPRAHVALERAARERGAEDEGFVRNAEAWLDAAGLVDVDVRTFPALRSAPFDGETLDWLAEHLRARLDDLDDALGGPDREIAHRAFDPGSRDWFARRRGAWFLVERVGLVARVPDRRPGA